MYRFFSFKYIFDKIADKQQNSDAACERDTFALCVKSILLSQSATWHGSELTYLFHETFFFLGCDNFCNGWWKEKKMKCLWSIFCCCLWNCCNCFEKLFKEEALEKMKKSWKCLLHNEAHYHYHQTMTEISKATGFVLESMPVNVNKSFENKSSSPQQAGPVWLQRIKKLNHLNV